MLKSIVFLPSTFLLFLHICLGLTVNCSFIFAQNIQFERIPNELGLSQNLISCLYQDQKGFLWVGTKDGLNRYDGYQFKVYRSNAFDTTTLSNNFIQGILEDRVGHLWVGTTDGLNILDRSKGTFHRITVGPDGLRHHEITGLAEGADGSIWVMTSGGGLHRFWWPTEDHTPAALQVEQFGGLDYIEAGWPGTAMQLRIDQYGNIWTYGTEHLTRIYWEEGTATYEVQQIKIGDLNIDRELYQQFMDDPTIKNKDRVYLVFLDKEKHFWAATSFGLSRWNQQRQSFDFLPIAMEKDEYGDWPLEGTIYGTGMESTTGEFWLSGFLSMVIVDPATGRVIEKFSNKSGKLAGLPNANVLSIFEDRSGVIWAGTNGDGLFKFVPHVRRFNRGKHNRCWLGRSIRSIYETSDGVVWVGTTQAQLLQWDLAQNEMHPVILDERWKRDAPERFSVVYTMLEDQKKDLWLGGPKGLFRFEHQQGEVKDWSYYPIGQFKEQALSRNGVRDIYEDQNGRIWVITLESFGWFDPTTAQFHSSSYLPITGGEGAPGHYPCIHQQGDGTFWLGTSNGLLRYNQKDRRFKRFASNPENPESISNNIIKCIIADPKLPDRFLWIGTGGGGLNRFDLKEETFIHFSIEDGLPDQVVYSILEDSEGFFWLSTNQGLARMDPTALTFRNYNQVDGLQDNEFNTSAYFKSKTGRMFLGGIQGINVFDPLSIQDNPVKPPIVITGFNISNQPVVFGETNTPFDEPITEHPPIRLSYKDQVFSFDFAALEFSDPSRNEYAYMLEGFDMDWQYIGQNRTATFTNIDPGHYTFRVKGTNNDGIWNDTGISLPLTVSPPWWQTWWAYTLMGVIGMGGLLFFYQFNLNRQLAQQEARRLRELDELKNQLYTNITHEFRTPLTVIKGMAEQVPQVWEIPSVLEIIRRNSDNLLMMVNQMLDLAKLESGSSQLKLRQADIVMFLRYLTESFHTMAEDQNKQLTFQANPETVFMDFDEEKIRQIVYNLISNAIKFTPEGGSIAVQSAILPAVYSEEVLALIVSDTGIGIPPEKLPNIFDRFYQVDASTTRKAEGTGIGLTLTKQLVELMEGQISVESIPNSGTTFTILLPIKQSAPLEEVLKPVSPHHVPSRKTPTQETPASILDSAEDLPVLLVIEDHADVVTYIKRCVQKHYKVETAENGQIGIDKAMELVPDIIISDVMMPEKDGYEVTETLKNDTRTSHIPIIILTAKATQEDKLTGLRTGADAFLMKPFNKEELLIRLANLVDLRKQLQEKYHTGVPMNGVKPEQPSLEDEFLMTIQSLILDRLDDVLLSVDDLAKAVHLSHTQMYRKLKALTGKTPTLFIRSIRLQKGHELLASTHLNVSEVTYEVGFKDPNYFSRVFQKEFGILPSEVVSGR
jgi:signal transduction histidine kinase/ligand-binding sensor domain-containing protein/DNA-binding response OmpR family regulator